MSAKRNGAPASYSPPDRSIATPVVARTRITRRRLVLVHALIVATTLLAVIGMLSVYANRLLFNPDKWEAQSTQLLQNPAIRSATARYVVDQLYAHADVAGLIKSTLPSELQPLAGPAAGALHSTMMRGIELLLERRDVQALWAQANRAADQAFIAVVNGDAHAGPAGVPEGAVTLDLASIVDAVAARLGLPPNVGARLPATIGTLTVLRSDQLKAVQDIGRLIEGLALWLTILVPLLFIAATALASGHRRRTLMTVGFAIVLVGIAGVAIRSILVAQATATLTSDASLRGAIHAALAIVTARLGALATSCILIGVVLVVAAFLAGLILRSPRTLEAVRDRAGGGS